MDEFNKLMAKRVGIPTLDWETYYLDSVEVVPGMAELVRWTAERYRIGLLTNIMPEFCYGAPSPGTIAGCRIRRSH